MAVSAQFSAFLLDTLGAVRPITARRMFGGVGYYADGWFFAIADDDQLYFRVDAASRGYYEREGMEPFCPTGPGTKAMSYYTVPARLFDDAEEFARWMARALVAARAAAGARQGRRRPRAAPR